MRRSGWLAAAALVAACADETPTSSSDRLGFVKPEPREPTTITVRLDARPANGLVAFQDGDGAWQQAPAPSAENTYQFTVNWSRYAVAWAAVEGIKQAGPVFRVGAIHYRSTDETQELVQTVAGSYPERPGSLAFTNECDNGLARTKWAPVTGASMYRWTMTLTFSPDSYCGTTHTDCVYQWHATFAGSVVGDSPRFEQPPLQSLAAWTPWTRYACVDATVTRGRLTLGMSAE